MSERDASDITGRDVVKNFLRREVKSITRYEPVVRNNFDREGVHQMRVSARRLRSELGALQSVLPKRPWRDLGDDLKWMGTTLGALRDLDVLTELFVDHLKAETVLHDAVMHELERRTRKRRHEVAALLDTSRYAKTVQLMGRLADKPHLGATGDRRADEVLLPSLWEASCTYLDAIGDPYAHRDDDDLHHVRIASKKCRYNFEVATLYLGDRAHAVATSLAQIQDILGQAHDRAVAVAFLDTLRGGGEDIDVRRQLRAEITQMRPAWIAHYDTARQGMLAVFNQA
jgi:CHAD domain-containing protein